MVPDRPPSVGFLRAFRCPPTAIRQMVKWTMTLNTARMKPFRIPHEMEIEKYKSNIGWLGGFNCIVINIK